MLQIFSVFFMLLLSSATLFSNSIDADLDQEARRIIDSNIPAAKYSPKYLRAVEALTDLLDAFAISKSNLDAAIIQAVTERLEQAGMTPDEISPEFAIEFEKKGKRVKETLLKEFRYKKFISREELERRVDREFDRYFWKKVLSKSSFSWPGVLGGFAAGFVSHIFSTAWEKFLSSMSTGGPHKQPIFFARHCCGCGKEFYGEERVGVLSKCGHLIHPECSRIRLKSSKNCPKCFEPGVFLAKIYDSINAVPGYSAATSSAFQESSSLSTAQTFYFDPICRVCLQSISSQAKVAVLSCGHNFHLDCAKNATIASKKCPYCQKSNIIISKIYSDKSQIPGYYESYNSSGSEEVETCSICLESILPTTISSLQLKTLPCCHKFHRECINNWLSSSLTCPNCRSEVPANWRP
jgi:hypothetical protein